MDHSRRTKIIALLPMGITLLFFLFFGFGEMLGGDSSGAGHLIAAAALVVLMLAGWKFPLWVGAGLVLFAILFTVPIIVNFVRAPGIDGKVLNIWPLLIISLPLLVSGMLLLGAYRQETKGARI
jgi:hypothetical protein